MLSDRELAQRRGMRLQDYDYAQPGLYFITLCTHQREALFGLIHAGSVEKNRAGEMVQEVWEALPSRFPSVELDAFVLMPNHIHGLLCLTQTWPEQTVGRGEPCVRPPLPFPPVPPLLCPPLPSAPRNGRTQGSPLQQSQTGHHPSGTDMGTIGRIIQAFKSLTTYEYTQGVKQNGWPPFNGRMWQRNYYDHIVRDEQSLKNIRNYIDANPGNWGQDDENPLHHAP